MSCQKGCPGCPCGSGKKRSGKSGRKGRSGRGKRSPDIRVALAGNPNVGKSTLFNTLTGMRVHTGNWAGKTVGCESGLREFSGKLIEFIDIPGTYSLFSHSEEERIARDYIAFGGADITVIVCDASALGHNLNLALQICEGGGRAILAVNLISEAERRGIKVDLLSLSEKLGIPVIGIEAHKKKTLLPLLSEIILASEKPTEATAFCMGYPSEIESAVKEISLAVGGGSGRFLRFAALRLLDGDEELKEEIIKKLSLSEERQEQIFRAVLSAEERLFALGFDRDKIKDSVVESLVRRASEISDSVTERKGEGGYGFKIDKILTGRVFAYPFMLILLALVFFITLSLANYPSALLSELFEFLEVRLIGFFEYIEAPLWLTGALIEGVFRTLGRVVAVMLPPMAIFFPLFALLEDSGYLPRIAYNLDRPFAKAGACGKQALTMCMGFGCNAVGIVGCRIIDSKRERTLAILTNSLTPCNGRLPMLVTLISVFYLFFMSEAPSYLVAATLSLVVVISILATFLLTALLSHTLFRGERSSFTVELPPYRMPRIFSTVASSLLDKCGSVLLRAAAVAAPMGLIIWVIANIRIGDVGIIAHLAGFLDPFASFFGMDGAIFLAFILGIPANEIVVPILLMIYSSGGAMAGEVGLGAIRELLLSAGWTPITAASTVIFALFHFPCSTSLLTVYKETKSIKSTLLAFALPTALGLLLCALVNFFGSIFFL